MTVTPGNFELGQEQKRVRTLLLNYPSLPPYWDFNPRECDIPALNKRMKTMSHGERVVVQFFSKLRLGENSNGFDLIESIKTLEEDSLSRIEKWVADPFFP